MVNIEAQQALNRALVNLGQGYRNDWSEVDGRTIRDEMEQVALLSERALQDESDILEKCISLENEWKEWAERH